MAGTLTILTWIIAAAVALVVIYTLVRKRMREGTFITVTVRQSRASWWKRSM
jgi:hypothetical protein